MKTAYVLGSLTVLAICLAVGTHHLEWVIYLAYLAPFVLGTATVQYLYPFSGTTQGSATQMAAHAYNLATGTILIGDTDTTATFIHNLGTSTTELAALLPLVSFYPSANTSGSSTSPNIFTNIALSTTNVIFTKASIVGSGSIWNVSVQRPGNTIR
jgi:hypothetical protein